MLIIIKTYQKVYLSSAKSILPKSSLIKIINVPGVFEIPVTISKNIKKYDAFLALGCVIKGQTPHFDFISYASTDAIMKLSIENKKPIGNGIITCLNMRQAIARKKKGKRSSSSCNICPFSITMRTPYNPNQSPRVIIIQKLYGNFFNDDTDLTFPKHRFKKFIKDVVLGTIERDEVIKEEVKKYLSEDITAN